MSESPSILGSDERRRHWLLALLALALLVALTGVADRASQAHADALFRRALITFGSARALDAVISAAQGTEIALSPAGMGLTLSAGELLDPLNDLVEQFATIMLLAATSLGIQSVALRISAWWGITALLVVAAGVWTWLQWRPRTSPGTSRLARRALVLLLALRFAIPAVTLASYWVFEVFLAPEQEAAMEVLETTQEEVGALAEVGEEPAGTQEQRSWMQRLREWVSGTPGTDIQSRLEAFRDQVAAAVEHIVRLIVIFVLQTVVLPLLLLWAAGRIVGSWLG